MIPRLLPLLGLLLLAGCASSRIHREYDPSTDFAAYASFGWLPRPASSAETTPSILDSDLVRRRLESAVETELVRKGLQRSEAPDLLVAVHPAVRDRVNVTDWGYGYGEAGYDWEERDVEAYPYREGTLVLDLVDARTKQLVWRGTASTPLDETAAASPEKLERELGAVVARLLEEYPPAGN